MIADTSAFLKDDAELVMPDLTADETVLTAAADVLIFVAIDTPPARRDDAAMLVTHTCETSAVKTTICLPILLQYTKYSQIQY